MKKLHRVLAENGTDIDEGQCYLVIPEFQEWFQENIFVASSTNIAWHLNEIRWGIFEYLTTEYRRAHRPAELIQGAQMYEYDVPLKIKKPLIRTMYWDLMNNMRNPPYFPRFTVQKYFRDIY